MLLRGRAAAIARVLHDPAPVSRLMQFGDSGIDLELRFWIADPQEGVNNVRSDVNRAIWRAVPRARHHHPGGAARGAHGARVRGGGTRELRRSIPERPRRSASCAPPGPAARTSTRWPRAAQLRFDLAGTQALNERVKARLRALAGRRLTAEGEILIIARNHRTQEGNRREALARLDELIGRALVEPKLRRATRPTRASKERRLEGKARSQKIKRLRRPVRGED